MSREVWASMGADDHRLTTFRKKVLRVVHSVIIKNAENNECELRTNVELPRVGVFNESAAVGVLQLLRLSWAGCLRRGENRIVLNV